MDKNLEKTKLLPEINIKKGQSGEIRVSFSYNPFFLFQESKPLKDIGVILEKNSGVFQIRIDLWRKF